MRIILLQLALRSISWHVQLGRPRLACNLLQAASLGRAGPVSNASCAKGPCEGSRVILWFLESCRLGMGENFIVSRSTEFSGNFQSWNIQFLAYFDHLWPMARTETSKRPLNTTPSQTLKVVLPSRWRRTRPAVRSLDCDKGFPEVSKDFQDLYEGAAEHVKEEQIEAGPWDSHHMSSLDGTTGTSFSACRATMHCFWKGFEQGQGAGGDFAWCSHHESCGGPQRHSAVSDCTDVLHNIWVCLKIVYP